MNNTGQIYALDQFEHKTSLIAENAQRLGIGIVEPLTGDARRWRPAALVDGVLWMHLVRERAFYAAVRTFAGGANRPTWCSWSPSSRSY